MTINEYQTLTGITVRSGNRAAISAQLNRSQAILEDLLGYTLDPDQAEENLYNELGKSQSSDWSCSSVDTEALLPPDEVIGAYRLFHFDPRDAATHIDPLLTVNAVKLVHGDVTIATFQAGQWQLRQGNVKKFIELPTFGMWPSTFNAGFPDFFTAPWAWPCGHRPQLAIDADWLASDEEVPAELKYILTEMATYYADPKRDVLLESAGGHSYRKYDDTANRPSHIPQDLPANAPVIRRWAGPAGTATPRPV